MSNKKPIDEHLIVEYQAAQNSAQHHDTLIWSVNAVVWGATFLLWGFLLNHTADSSLKKVIILLISLVGILMNVKVLIYTHQLANLKTEKYKRCKFIEEKLCLEQHRSVTWTSGLQRTLYSIIMTLFLVVWILIAVKALMNN